LFPLKKAMRAIRDRVEQGDGVENDEAGAEEGVVRERRLPQGWGLPLLKDSDILALGLLGRGELIRMAEVVCRRFGVRCQS
jgi:hypothetical protein